MSDDYDGKVNGEVVLNLADWIERRRDAVGPYADHIIHSVRAHEAEISRLRAEVERLKSECQRITAESVKMLNEDAADYNRKTNAMIERHADQVAQLTAALSEERAHADAMAEWAAEYRQAIIAVDGGGDLAGKLDRVNQAAEWLDDLLSAHRARRQG
jgi:predicted RNase H-like nuclease (RuvC/YqgF family)